MSATTGSRAGETVYNQAIVESATSKDTVKVETNRSGKDVTTGVGKSASKATTTSDNTGAQESVTARDLKSNSAVTRRSTEHANVAFNVSFKIPVLGRFPISKDAPC
jgi:hypothetical protein